MCIYIYTCTGVDYNYRKILLWLCRVYFASDCFAMNSEKKSLKQPSLTFTVAYSGRGIQSALFK